MKVGLIGFAQSGKSTLFKALTGVDPDPSAVMKGQVGISHVADTRLDFLSNMYNPKKKTPAIVEFIDTPGLVRGEQGDNPQRIATLRTADGLVIVINAYDTSEDPAAQLRTFRDELVFADLMVLSARIERLETGVKKGKTGQQREIDMRVLEDLKAIVSRLENGQSIVGMKFGPDTERDMKSYQLFSLKPELVVMNVTEDRVRESPPESLKAICPHVIVLSASLEKDLSELSDEDRPAFMAEMGVAEVARHRVTKGAYDAVRLISFFTVGEDECKAWTITRGTPAVEAAGKIHSDIQRGFIRAEVVAYDDLVRLKTMKDVKAAGLQRLEGKEYVVLDGDIINYRFNV